MKLQKTLVVTAAVIAIALLGREAIPAFAQNITGTGQQQAGNDIRVAGTVVVTSKPQQVLNYAKSNNLKPNFVEKTASSKQIIVLDELPSDPDVKKLSRELDVKVAPNYIYETFFTPNDPKYSSQWNLTKIKAPAAWDITRGSTNTTVAVIDTGTLFSQTINGTTYTQPDFPTSRQWENSGEKGNTQAGDTCWGGAPEDKSTNNCDDDGNGKIDDWRGWDFMGGYRGSDAGCPNNGDPSTYESPGDATFVTQDNDPQPYSCDSPTSPSTLNKNHYDGRCIAWVSACYIGHGTMVGSVIASTTDNNQLIAGIDHNTKVMNVRVADGYGYTTSARIAAGINYAADNGANVINMSLGMACGNENFTDSTMESAITAAKAADIVLVAASGNNGWGTICYPASSPGVMAIGATNQSDRRLSYSNYSNKLDVVAPSGVPVANAPSAYINSTYYGSAGGTSLSTPHVAGLAALIKGNAPSLTRTEIMDLISDRADKVAGMGGRAYYREYGHGRINLYTPLAVTDGTLPVYRLFRPQSVSHFYTKSTKERDRVISRYGYRYEGIGFRAPNTTVGTSPVYRLFRPKSVSHFYTRSTGEKNRSINLYGYRYEGIGFRSE